MTIQLPDTAPFSPEQRAWLSGFFSGLMNVPGGSNGAAGANGATGVGAPDQHETNPAEGQEEFPWHDPQLPMGERLKLAEGKPPARVLMAAMAQLDCGSCGYLCETYAEAIATGSDKDLSKCVPGGSETKKKLKELTATLTVNGAAPAAGGAAPAAKAAAAPGSYSRDNPFPARLVQAATLNRPGSSKDVRHVVIDLRNSGLAYKVGDALGVYPENAPELVQELLEALHASGAEDVENPKGELVSLRSALLHDFTITKPSDELLELLSRCVPEESHQAELKKLASEGLPADDSRLVIDLLHHYPDAKLKPDEFVATLAPLQPRLYSISSSLLAHPNQVHLTVGVVRYTNVKGRAVRGVASNHLADNIRPGQHVRIFVHPSPKFGLPKDPATPVIMVGPGTGIAPFRAFLQERRVDRHPGKNWLFFGDQRGETDFLYKEEIHELLLEGVLTRLDTAFSRDQEEKIYVQTRMLQNGAELWKWLNEGAYFYVCGDAKRMAADVDKSLRQIIAEHGNTDADAYMAEFTKAGRYQRDVY